ncbi:MAG: MFS transporter [Phycisphaerales bacterium]|nr:MFS transporter [Phycisphaerales bacterium]
MTQAEDRKGRHKLLAMAGAYGMGVFNDSFYRTAAMLLALSAFKNIEGEGEKMQSWIMAIFTVPYLLFPWVAGWLADRFSKRRVVIGSKFMELVAMSCGAVGIWTETWWLVLVMAFMMGFQSCVFGPALNGSVPELFDEKRVVMVNSRLKMVMAIMIVLGIAVSGEVLSLNGDGTTLNTIMGVPSGQFFVGVGVIVLALMGWIVSFGVPYHPPAAPNAKFPIGGPVHTIRTLWEIFHDRDFRTILLIDVWIWTFGAMLLLGINPLPSELNIAGEDAAMRLAARLNAVEMLGLAVGGVLSVYLSRRKHWIHLLGVGMLLLGLSATGMKSLAYVPESFCWPLAYLFQAITGLAVGLVMIPCESFLQIRPPADRKGEMLAAGNFLVFAGITAGALGMGEMTTCFGAANSIMMLGIVAFPMGLWLLFYRSRDTEEPHV